MLTELGTVTFGLLLESATDASNGTGADRVTVQTEVPGLFTVAGEQFKLLGTMLATRCRVVDWLPAVTVAVCALLTVPLLAANVASLRPAGIVTLAGTVKLGLLLPSATIMALSAG